MSTAWTRQKLTYRPSAAMSSSWVSFDDLALVEHEYSVSPPDCREAMGDDEGGNQSEQTTDDRVDSTEHSVFGLIPSVLGVQLENGVGRRATGFEPLALGRHGSTIGGRTVSFY